MKTIKKIMEGCYSFELSIPPSVNAMYRRSRGSFGMFKTREAKDWIADSLKKIGKVKTIKGMVDVEAFFFFDRERDLDNNLKALMDVLQESKLIENDKQVYSILATKGFNKKNPHVEVVVRQN